MTTSSTFTMLAWWKLSRMLISRTEVTGKPSRSFSILTRLRATIRPVGAHGHACKREHAIVCDTLHHRIIIPISPTEL